MKEDLEDTLRALGRDFPGGHAAHPGDDALAAWIDGVASAEEAESIESHLAACPECRAVAADVAMAAQVVLGATAIDDASPDAASPDAAPADGSSAVSPLRAVPGGKDPASIPRRRAGSRRSVRRSVQTLAAVAALFVLVLGAWRLVSWDPRLGELGVPMSRNFTESSRVAEMRAALAGEWPRPDFEAFEEAPGEVVLRGAEAPRTPEPLEPSWSAVHSGRPPLVVGSPGIGGPGEPLRVLVVDAREEVAASFTVQVSRASAGPAELSVPWPDGVPALEAGVYAWKVSLENLDLAASSAWVPFRVLGGPEIAALDRRLDGAGPLEAALLLAEAGLFAEARHRLEAVDDAELRRRLLDGLERSRMER